MLEPAFSFIPGPALEHCYVYRLIVTKQSTNNYDTLSITLSYIYVCTFFVIKFKYYLE